MNRKEGTEENEVTSLVADEPELIIRSDHGSVNDIDEIVSRLKHRSSCSSCSASIVYLFTYSPGYYRSSRYPSIRLRPRYPYMEFDDLYGIVVCDHSIVTDDILDDLLRNYRRWEPPYWYVEDGIILCSMLPSGMSWGLGHAMEEFDEIIEDPDYLKLKPYIRDVVDRTIHSLRPIAEDPRKRAQALCYHNEIKLIDFTIEL